MRSRQYKDYRNNLVHPLKIPAFMLMFAKQQTAFCRANVQKNCLKTLFCPIPPIFL